MSDIYDTEIIAKSIQLKEDSLQREIIKVVLSGLVHHIAWRCCLLDIENYIGFYF